MKIRVTLKDPDSMHDAVQDAYRRAPKPVELRADEWVEICADRALVSQESISEKWMPYSEYLTVEFDTETGTATVIPASEFK